MNDLYLNSNLNIKKLLEENAFLRHENKILKEDLAHYQELVRLLKHQKFAPKTETSPLGMRTLFDEAETEAVSESELSEEYGPWPLKTKKRGKPVRKPLPRDLDRVSEVIDISETEKICPYSGETLVKIGEEVSEKLSIEPAKLTVIEIIRPKYLCKCHICTGEKSGSPTEVETSKVKIAEPAVCAIPKSIATPSLLAFIAVGKYADALPLYRQESIFTRSGIDMPRSTMATWMVKCGQLVMPLINLAKDELLDSKMILADETRYQILSREGQKRTSQSYVWVFMKDEPGRPKVIIYEIGPTRAHTVPLQFLDGYEGYLLTDGYKGYDSLVARAPGIILVNDWVHVRRKFDEAMKAHGKLPGIPKAKEGLKLINELFFIENKIESLSSEARLQIRQEESKEIIDKLLSWAQSAVSTVPPKSLTASALNYMLDRWPKLIRFLNDPILRIDTNPVENAIRPFAIGRKNWLFSETMAGAESSAAIYSLVCMARAAGHNCFEYLKAVFDELPKAKTADEVAALLPWNWKIEAPS
jgi:transposase